MTSGEQHPEVAWGDRQQESLHEANRAEAQARRHRMRTEVMARSLARRPRPVEPDRYETPEWLDRSFVLPLTRPEDADVAPAPRDPVDPVPESPRSVPSQTWPRHDDLAAPEEVTPRDDAAPLEAAPETFVRPETPEIDFARVVHRSDLSRVTARVAWLTLLLSGVALVAYLVTGAAFALGALTVLAVASIGAGVVRARLDRAAVPLVRR